MMKERNVSIIEKIRKENNTYYFKDLDTGITYVILSNYMVPDVLSVTDSVLTRPNVAECLFWHLLVCVPLLILLHVAKAEWQSTMALLLLCLWLVVSVRILISEISLRIHYNKVKLIRTEESKL